jgi:hypothetical protein
MDEAMRERFEGMVESARLTPKAISHSWPVYREGAFGRAYFNFDTYSRDPGHLLAAGDYFTQVLAYLRRKRPLHALAFLRKNDENDNSTVGAILLAGLICTNRSIWLPHVVVKLGGMVPHDRVALSGPASGQTALIDKNVAIVTDHVSGGDEVFKAVQTLELHKAKVTDVVTFSVWMDLFQAGAMDSFKSADVEFHYLCELKQVSGSDEPDLVYNDRLDIPEEAALSVSV